jgi:hypothetical protein
MSIKLGSREKHNLEASYESQPAQQELLEETCH